MASGSIDAPAASRASHSGTNEVLGRIPAEEDPWGGTDRMELEDSGSEAALNASSTTKPDQSIILTVNALGFALLMDQIS